MPPLRMTLAARLVLQVFLADPDEARYGAAVSAAAGLPSGTIQPILARLEGAGWLTSRWEDGDARALKRPTRRYYRMTDEGVAAATRALARTASRPLMKLDVRPGLM